jgi:hypothetical protein
LIEDAIAEAQDLTRKQALEGAIEEWHSVWCRGLW